MAGYCSRMAVLATCLVTTVPAAHAAGLTVQTTGGTIGGIAAAGADEWLGVPYAAPPLGALRWTAPQPTSWSGVLAASILPPACPQNAAASGLAPAGATANASESCLFLNVYAPPSGAARLPVMVWFHGGGNEVGTGSSYDGTSLVQDGVIVVTVNYRLGILGFLADPALDAESPGHASGDYGLMDQQAALRWVRDNIAAFGGDPGRVTVFGQGSGGQDIADHLVSPTAAGLFSRAIIESGGYAVLLPTLAAADAEGQTFASSVGCTSTTDASCLRALPLATLLAGEVGPGSPYLATNVLRFEPNIGTAILPNQPIYAYAAGHELRLPVIVGTNHDEARLDVGYEFDATGEPLTAAGYLGALASVVGPQINGLVATQYPLSAYPSPDLAFATAFTDVGFSCISRLNDQLLALKAPVYAYEFNDPNASSLSLPSDPFLPPGSADTTELPFLWPNLVGTNNAARTAFSAPEQALAGEMQLAWSNFAKAADPNGSGVTGWAPFAILADQFHSFTPGAVGTTSGFTADHKCNFWEPLEIAEALMP